MSVIDQHPLPMEHEHIRQLLKFLADRYPRTDDAKGIVDELGLVEAEFSWQLPMAHVWPQILKRAAEEKDGARRLVKHVVKRDENRAYARHYASLFADLLRPSRRWYRAPDPYNAYFVGPAASLSFIDRSELRLHLRRLLQGDYRVLVVNGPHGSGISYTRHLVTHVVVSERWVNMAWVDVSVWAGEPAMAPLDVMRWIASQLGLPDPTVDDFAHPDNQARVLANKLMSQLRTSDKLWLLIFDGVDRPTLTPGAFRLIETIAVDALSRLEIPIRVILLGYDRTLPGDCESGTLREWIRPIERPELRKCLEDAALHLNVTLDPEAIDTALDAVLVDLPVDQPLPLAELSAKIARVAQLVFAGADND